MFRMNRPLLLLLAVTLLAPLATAVDTRYFFSLQGDQLMRRTSTWDIRAIEYPDLAADPLDMDTYIPVVHRIAQVGGDSVIFDMAGITDEATIERGTVSPLVHLIDQLRWRSIAPIIRIVPADAPDDVAWQTKLASAVGDTMAGVQLAVYLVDGPHAAEVAAAFKAKAPKNLLVSPTGGDITLVHRAAEAESVDGPVFVMGELPDEPNAKIHYGLPHAPQSYARYEQVSALDVEHEAWTPDNSILSEEEQAEGWIALFNGTSFDGWAVTGSEDAWDIVDGALLWKRRGGGVVRTRDRYDNFVLRFEYWIAEGGNSGLFTRAPRGGRSSKIGMEFQILGDHGETPHRNSTGSIYDVVPAATNPSKPSGEWNQVEIMINGPMYRSTLNGVEMVNIQLDAHPELKYRLRSGFIAVQDHGHPVGFRNIRILPL